MSLADAFAPAEAAYAAQVVGATWGHLAPEPRRAYQGYIVFAHAGYGGAVVLLDASFVDLDDSPWLCEDMTEYVDAAVDRTKDSRGSVFRFDGTYMKFKNGRCRFSGKLRRLQAAAVLRRR